MCRNDVAGGIEKHDDGVAQDALELRSPAVIPNRVHRRDDALGQELAIIRRHVGKDVEGDRILGVGKIEEAYLVASVRRHERQALFGQRAVRIDQQHAVAAGDVLRDDRLEQRRLAHAGLAEDGDLAQALCEREGDGVAARIGTKSGVFHIWASTGERSDRPGRRDRNFVGLL